MRAQSDVISIAIISAIIVAAGIALWAFYSGYASVARISAQEEVNKELSVLRSMISADYVLCPQGIARIRNIGKEPVIIFRLIVYKNGEMIWDSLQAYGIKKLAEVNVSDVSDVSFTCPARYSTEDVVTLLVHYAPKLLFDPSLELIYESSDVLLFKIANFRIEEASIALVEEACPDISRNWAWIDFVNPEEAPPDGDLHQRIGVRIPKVSNISREFTMSLRVNVKGASGLKSAIVSGIRASDETQWINIDMSGLRHPVTITFEAIYPDDLNVLQQTWYFDAIETSYVNYVQLIWNNLDEKLVGAYVSVFHRISGTYNVTVRIIDCFGNVVSEGSLIKDVHVGAAGRWEEYYVTFRSGEIMSNIRRIEVYIEDLSAVAVETKVETVTESETVTQTLTHWVTEPTSTITEYFTITTTRTITAPATTYTTPSWVTSTSTTTLTSTSTSTVTTTGFTITQTTSVTTTRTTTRYLSTVTVTSTTTRYTTTTSFSTTYRTVTTSIPTTTRTVTSTSTVVTTVPTTTVSLTTTTTSITTYNPPPVTETIIVTQTTTAATTTVSTTTTVGTTATSTVTKTETRTSCPPPSQLSQPSLSTLTLAALFMAPAFMISIVMRRCRR